MRIYHIPTLLLLLQPAQAAPALLGLQAETTADSVRRSFAEHIPAGTGLTIRGLPPGTAAAEHLQPGDVLLEAEGKPLQTPEELAALVQSKQAGDTLHLLLLRHGEKRELSLRLSARPEQPSLTRAQQVELNRLLLLLVPHSESTVDIPAVRRHMLRLSEQGLASRDTYDTCTLHLHRGQHLITISSTERSLSIRSNAPEVPDALLRADYYKRDTKRLPEKLEQLLLQAEYYRP